MDKFTGALLIINVFITYLIAPFIFFVLLMMGTNKGFIFKILTPVVTAPRITMDILHNKNAVITYIVLLLFLIYLLMSPPILDYCCTFMPVICTFWLLFVSFRRLQPIHFIIIYLSFLSLGIMIGFISCDIKTSLYHNNPYIFVSLNYALSFPLLIIYLLYYGSSKTIPTVMKYEKLRLMALYLFLFFLEYHSVVFKFSFD